MLGYIIIVEDHNKLADQHYAIDIHKRLLASTDRWRCFTRAAGRYAVYVDSTTPEGAGILLHDDRGAVLGQLFSSPTSDGLVRATPISSFSRVESAAVVESRGRSLISSYWGYYVAVIYDPIQSIVVAMRSPASPLPCFHTKIGTLDLFFSFPADLVSLKLGPLTVNWDSITAQIVGADFLTSETAFNEITALDCGEIMECSPNGSVRCALWDPRDILRERRAMSFSEASTVVRRVVDYSVNALLLPHKNVLVSLSGGLDSSIVLNSLSRSPDKPNVTAVNYHSNGCGDERYYARVMARHTQCRLIENCRDVRLDLRRFSDCNLTARPVLNFSAPDVEARNSELARECGATAIFNGELGDNVFGRWPTPGVLVECLRHMGISPRVLSVAIDYAMLTRQSIWKVVMLTTREYRTAAQGQDFNTLKKLQERHGIAGAMSLTLASSAAEQACAAMATRFLHPWLRQAREIAPGSDKLLFGLVAVTSPLFHSPFASRTDPAQISPFLSQPVIEALLAIPGYLHCHRAQDRAVARAAFSDSLPDEILNRGLGKGGPDLWAKAVIENNLKFIREFLLDGLLVKRGLLDRGKLEIVLAPKIVQSTAVVGDIFAKLYIEAWLAKALPLADRSC